MDVEFVSDQRVMSLCQSHAIQLGTDSEHNQPIKTVAAQEWEVQTCPKSLWLEDVLPIKIFPIFRISLWFVNELRCLSPDVVFWLSSAVYYG